MTRQEEVIEMLEVLKTSARKYFDSTMVEDVRLDSFTFVIDEAIKQVQEYAEAGELIKSKICVGGMTYNRWRDDYASKDQG